jgi:hypothetical protein
MTLTALAQAIGKGLIAGFIGAAGMTVSSTIEMKIRGRAPSSTPARAAEKVLGIEKFQDKAAERRFGTLIHWAYGTGWGIVHGLLRTSGMPAPAATVAHLAYVWGSEQVMLPALDLAPPFTRWGSKEVAIDAWHHLVYAVTTGVAYEALNRRG